MIALGSMNSRRDMTIRITIETSDLRQALVDALNGNRIAPDLAWGILHRWDRLNAKDAELVADALDSPRPKDAA